MEPGAEKLVKIGLRPWVYESPQVIESFWFENVDGNELRFWTREHLPHCTAICVAYFISVLLGLSWMKHRKALKLEAPLFIWNIFLTVFSIIGASRTFPELIEVTTRPNGLYRSHCLAEYLHYPETFWGFAFTLSKVFELIDTVFLILRKKPVSFLHCFHHLTMLWVTFYGFSEGEPISRYVIAINYTVHSLMYFYFALKAVNIRVPKLLSMTLTTVQILQFLIGLCGTVYTFTIIANGGECFRTVKSMQIQAFVLLCYTILFVHFFYKTYVASPKSKSK